MLYRPIKFLATWFGVLAFLANTSVLGSGWVLCAEPDGRVAVELAGVHDPCSPTPVIACSSEDVGCIEHLESDEHFGCEPCPCNDTPLGIELAPLQRKIQLLESSDDDPYTGSSSPYLVKFQYCDADRVVALNFNTHLGHSAQILSLRKVVFLI